MNRRDFLTTTALASAGLTISLNVPGLAGAAGLLMSFLARPASEVPASG